MGAVVLHIRAPFSDVLGLLPSSIHIVCIGMHLRDQRSLHPQTKIQQSLSERSQVVRRL